MAFILFFLDQETEEILEPGDTQPMMSLQKGKRRNTLTSLYYLITKRRHNISQKIENRTEHHELSLTEKSESVNCKCNRSIIRQ